MKGCNLRKGLKVPLPRIMLLLVIAASSFIAGTAAYGKNEGPVINQNVKMEHNIKDKNNRYAPEEKAYVETAAKDKKDGDHSSGSATRILIVLALVSIIFIFIFLLFFYEKTRRKNFKIRTRILAGFGSMVALLFILSIVNYQSLSSLGNEIEAIAEEDIPCMHVVTQSDTNMMEMQISMERVMKFAHEAGADNEMRKEEAKFKSLTDKSGEHFNKAEKVCKAIIIAEGDSEDGKNVRTILEAIKKIKGEQRQFEDAVNMMFTSANKKDLAALSVMEPKLEKEADDVSQQCDAAMEKLAKITEKSSTRAETDEKSAVTLLIVLSTVGVAVAFIFGFVVAISITKPINKVVDFSEQLAQGDLTRRIAFDQKDELGQMSAALNNAAENLEQLISSIMVGSQNLAQAVEQISSGNQNLSQRTSEQASSLEEIASTIEEATAAINQNAENAGRAKELTDTGVAKSLDGNRVALEAVNSINEMNDSSKKVADIISTINEIAFQTNLLALNAAVEAARAGEAGAGFAVVADEVRSLALRAAEAARNTQELIEQTVQRINDGTTLVRATQTGFQEVRQASGQVSGLIGQIASASREQAQGVEQVALAMSQMDRVVQQTAAHAEESAAAAEELKAQASSLQDSVQEITVLIQGQRG